MTGILEFVIFTFIIYWFFGSRAFAMVDVLSNRVHAVYTKWERGSKHNAPNQNKLPVAPGKTCGSFQRRENLRTPRNSITQYGRDKDLFSSKESQWFGFPTRMARPFMDTACKACCPKSRDYINSYSSNIRSIQNILKTDTETDDFFMTRMFSHVIHNYRLKKFYYAEVDDSILNESKLKEAIETAARGICNSKPAGKNGNDYYRQILKAQEARARNILLGMRSTLSDFLLRITSWLLYKLLPRFLTSVCLHPAQLAMLQKAADSHLPLIFVPLHRSHLDYILITFILLNINVKSPLVAAGNNLCIPVFGWLLRGLGAFFIKRRIDPEEGRKDIVYRAVLHTYMISTLRSGHNIEFYIEGGRTRTGKPCMPKGGLLSIVIDAYMAGAIEDALLVPVSVNYDKLVDGNFIRELLGKPKELETFSSAISAIWTTLNSNYGSMRVDFNQPFSLRELVKTFQYNNKLKTRAWENLRHEVPCLNDSDEEKEKEKEKGKKNVFRSVPSTTSLYGTDVVNEDHRVLVDNIARHLIYDCAKACAIMSTNTLAFLLLNKYRNGVRLEQLVISFDKLRRELKQDNRDVGFSGDSIDVINSAVKLLGPGLVKREMKEVPDSESRAFYEIITPVTTLPNVIELSYYSNALLSHFMMEGALAAAIGKVIKYRGTPPSGEIKVKKDAIIGNVREICDILQFEFIFSKPCESFHFVVNEVIDKFILMDILATDEIVGLWRRRLQSDYLGEYDDDVPYHFPTLYSVNLKGEEFEKFEFFHMMFRPLIDAYVVTAKCLRKLEGTSMSETDFVMQVLSEINVHLNEGLCSYGECSSVDPIKNALKLFKKWGVISMFSQDSVKFVNLTDQYTNEVALMNVYRRLLDFKVRS